jgi:hypothetical protein
LLKSILRRDGFIIMTTPNKSFYEKDILWYTEQPPVHMWWFSEESIIYMARQTGMSLSLINFKDYYRRRFHAVNMNILRKSRLPEPKIGRDGEIINKTVSDAGEWNIFVRYFLVLVNVLKELTGRFLSIFNKEYRICGERGLTLAVILKKK